MTNFRKLKVLEEIRSRFGEVRKIVGSESLYVIGNEAARVYFRYSKAHERGRSFFGLREIDLRELEGHNSYICFLLGDDLPPVFLPYSDFENIFANSPPAKDGQHKVQLFTRVGTMELYVPRQGRFNVEGYVGLDSIEHNLNPEHLRMARYLSHSQVQTLIAGIGHAKGYDIYVPEYDVGKLDWSLTKSFGVRCRIPDRLSQIKSVLDDIDVVWMATGGMEIEGLYEVEHSTPIYSGLLRFNDVLLSIPSVKRFAIASNETRREVFAR